MAVTALDRTLRKIVSWVKALEVRIVTLETQRPIVPSCRTSASGAFAAVSGAWRILTSLDTTDLDPYGMHTSGSVVTVTIPGIYACSGWGDFAANAGGTQRGLRLQQSGTARAASVGGVYADQLVVYDELNCVANNTISLNVLQDTGGNLDFTNAKLRVRLIR
jgi:hypothetical protein